MIITECVLHGFKGFVAPFTLRLKPGLNLVTGGNESGKSTLCEGILSALFASPSSSHFLNWFYPEACRILLVFSTPRGRFRTLKDFIRRSADLSIWDPAKATFLSKAQDPSQVAGLLSKELGEVTEAVYRTLYVLRPPSRSPVALAPEVTASPDPA
ncbi:MAG: AAA family ATPase, partial [candidate division NC10 bacterium]